MTGILRIRERNSLFVLEGALKDSIALSKEGTQGKKHPGGGEKAPAERNRPGPNWGY